MDRVADEGGRHGEGAESEVAGGEAAQVDIGDTLQGPRHRDTGYREHVPHDAETEEAAEDDAKDGDKSQRDEQREFASVCVVPGTHVCHRL